MNARRPSSRPSIPRTDQDAALYDAHVVPRYSALFGRMILTELPMHERLQVLDVGCGTGYPALEVLRRLGEGGRVIAIDPDPARIDLARRKALEEANRRIFFKVEGPDQLSFGDEVFDAVIGNLALPEGDERALAEIRRVLAPSGRLLLTRPLAGTWEEVSDMFREIALKDDDASISDRLTRIAARYPSPKALEAMIAGAGFSDVRVRVEEFQLAFGSAAEIFSDPAIRFVALPEWRWIAGFEDGSERVLEQVQRALETYFGGGPLSLRVCAGLVTARA